MSLHQLGKSFVEAGRPVPLDQPAAPNAKDNFDALTRYIPVETITLFVAAMATMTALAATITGVTKWHVYGFCALITPLLLWLSAFNAYRGGGGTGAFPFPWWRMTAATVAFLVWSLSVPPMLGDVQRPVAGLGALLVSFVLTQFDLMFDRK
jgi:hypothetical protein